MAYVTVPKDLTKIKTKMLFGLTKRQVFCFGSAALVGVPLFFLTKESLGTVRHGCVFCRLNRFFDCKILMIPGEYLESILSIHITPPIPDMSGSESFRIVYSL